jgi:hypothetical protein
MRRLVYSANRLSVGVNSTCIAIGDIAAAFKVRKQAVNCIRLEVVIGVQKHHKLASGHPTARIPRHRRTSIGL